MKTERMLWEKEIQSWSDFFEKRKKAGLSPNAARRITKWLEASENALQKKNVGFFAERLPKRELWRLYPEFKEDVAFLDVETTGLSFYYDDITMIGVFDGRKVKMFVQGQNLDDFKDEIRKYGVMVTYNGSLFDLRFIREKMGGDFLPAAHIDLRFLLWRLGHKGGLKAVEEQMGIKREGEISEIDGFGATVLWNRYVRGDDDALRLLALYNTADIIHLKQLLESAYQKLHAGLLQSAESSLFDSLPKPEFEAYMQRVHRSLLSLRIGNADSLIIDPRKNRTEKKAITELLSKLKKKMGTPRVVGIDLTGSEKRKTGWALLQGKHVKTRLLNTDSDIIETTADAKPDLISIDSPLSLPKGRDCTKDTCTCRRFGIMRKAERILRRRGVYVFPSLIRSMQPLTERGIGMRTTFEKRGFAVIESYPGAAQDILRIIRKKVSREDLGQGLANVGLTGEFVNGNSSHDELDAITSALVGYYYLAGEYEDLGNKEEGYLIVPKVRSD